MAPAIVHFLVGAAIILFLATPFAFRYDTERNWALWLVPFGGIWGLIPDFHHVAPVGSAWLYEKHTATWVDLFGLHYTLDRPTIRGLYHESIFVAILMFLVAVTVYSVIASLQLRGVRASTTREQRRASLLAFVVAAGYAGFVAGVVASALGILESVALLVGGNGLILSGVLFAPLSVIGGAAVWGLTRALGSERHRRRPLAGATVGLPIGIGSWLVGVAFGVPVWLRFGVGIAVSMPFVHWGSLVLVLVFSVVFGLVYATVRGAFVVPPGYGA